MGSAAHLRVVRPADCNARIFPRTSPANGARLNDFLLAFFRAFAKRAPAFLARAKSAEVIVAEDSGGMPICETDLNSVVADLGGGLRAGFRLKHGQEGRREEIRGGRHRIFFRALVVACRTGALIAKVGEIVVAGMAVGPGDVDTRAGFYVDFYRGGFFSLIDGYGHLEKYFLSESGIFAPALER